MQDRVLIVVLLQTVVRQIIVLAVNAVDPERFGILLNFQMLVKMQENVQEKVVHRIRLIRHAVSLT